MGYVELQCQLCGVSFAIARIRRIEEPLEAAWDYTGSGFIDSAYRSKCPTDSGCQLFNREEGRDWLEGDDAPGEHIAGPGCTLGGGYSGHQISLQEMKGCRAVRCLMRKEDGWQPEPDDQDFERESDYFLTGVGEGSPDESALQILAPIRHGVTEVWLHNIPEFFCYPSYKNFFEDFPRLPVVRNGYEQWWHHELGSEWLAANPVDVPGLQSLLDSCLKRLGHYNPDSDVETGAFQFTYTINGELRRRSTPPPRSRQKSDLFARLPREILYMVLGKLSSKEVASMRLVTQTCRQLPNIMFRSFIFQDMPWLWEAKDLPIVETDWRRLYQKIKNLWYDLKGLKNRRRIWKDVEEMVRLIERHRAEGDITDLGQ
ncbi:MAG: hypothetical protein M1818_002270 [Claussenomyces sp. TS43310]|nr:MAG: hypothetical protein M1818_002270 [Claussenomyces sp. TS43310]